MPYLSLRTNVALEVPAQDALMAAASTLLAGELGKSEAYIMVAVDAGAALSFGGGGANDPAAYLELKSIGLPAERTPNLAAALCAFVEREIGVPPDRTYIAFTDAERRMWGWDGRTFG